MMNILIAIVSDSFTDAMNRSLPLFWRARVELIAEYEPILPRLYDNAVISSKTERKLRNLDARDDGAPKTWQHKCLLFQEGFVATILITGIVLFELTYVTPLGMADQGVALAYAITVFFLAEIGLRYYVWRHTILLRSDEGSAHCLEFISNPFRFLDTFVVTLDTLMIIVGLHRTSEYSSTGAKLARAIRFSRSVRWLKSVKALRFGRFIKQLTNQVRQYLKPTRHAVKAALKDSLKKLEQRSSWAGRLISDSEKMNHDINRSTFQIIRELNNSAATISSLSERVRAIEKSFKDFSARAFLHEDLNDENKNGKYRGDNEGIRRPEKMCFSEAVKDTIQKDAVLNSEAPAEATTKISKEKLGREHDSTLTKDTRNSEGSLELQPQPLHRPPRRRPHRSIGSHPLENPNDQQQVEILEDSPGLPQAGTII